MSDPARENRDRTARTTTRLPGMDGLRAVACLTVFLANFHHSMGMTVSGQAGPLDLAYFAESGIGVVMLIVISGSLLSLPFWKRLHDGVHAAIPWRQFAIRRAVRLVPAYYVCLVLVLALSGNTPEPLDATMHFLFVNNLWERSFYSISPQFWTIGMFAQFSCLVPLVFLGLRALRLRGLPAVRVVGAASVGAYLLHWALMATRSHWVVWPISALTTVDGVVLSHSTLAHLPQFLLGVAGGYALCRLQLRPWDGRRMETACDVLFWLSAACAVLVASVPALGGLEMPYGRYLFPWMAGFAAIAVVTAPFAPLARRLLDAAPLRGLGVISYGVYVYQIVCMVAVHRLMGGATFESASAKLQFGVLGLGLTVVVAACSYVVIERPLLRLTERRHRPPQAASGAL